MVLLTMALGGAVCVWLESRLALAYIRADEISTSRPCGTMILTASTLVDVCQRNGQTSKNVTDQKTNRRDGWTDGPTDKHTLWVTDNRVACALNRSSIVSE